MWKLYVGVGACAAGLAACEAAEFALPSDALCVSGPSIRGDLDCNAGPGQHPKTVYATSLASVSTGSTTTIMASGYGYSYVAFDADYVAPEPWRAAVMTPSPGAEPPRTPLEGHYEAGGRTFRWLVPNST